MAAPMSFRVQIAKVSPGTLQGNAQIKKGVARNENSPIECVVQMTTAQLQGVETYLACIKNGDNTAAVEVAINAL